jgi:peptide/nickel transport system substrate-binding protein
MKILSGGSVTVAVPYLPSELNPATVAGANPVTTEIMAQVWPSAFVVASNGSPRPSTSFIDAAENVSLHPQTVVYTIDPRARWSNGDPIDAEDFIAEWKAQLALGPRLPANDPLAGYEDIASITSSPSRKQVTVVFKHPDADWEALFSELAPSRVAARYGWSAAFAGGNLSHLVSGGPFKIAKIVPSKLLVLVRNPAWWGTPAPLERIVFKVVRGQAALLRALEGGAIDVAEIQPGPALRDALMLHRYLGATTSLSPTLWQLNFNLADATMSHLLVRRAIATAIDRVELEADSIGWQRENVPISGSHLFLSGAQGSAGHGSDFANVDVPLADEMLAQAGYRLGADGLLHDAAGRVFVVRLTVPTGSRLVSEMTAELRAQLLDAGIVLRIVRMPLARLLQTTLPSGGYQLALAPMLLSPFPSQNATYYLDPVGPTLASSPFSVPAEPGSTTTTTTLAPSTSTGPLESAYAAGVGSETEPGAAKAGSVTRDVLGYSDPAVNSLLESAVMDLNAVSMANAYNEADIQIWKDLPSLPLFQVPVALVGVRRLLNLEESPTWMGPLWNAQTWALEVPVLTTPTLPSHTASATARARRGPSGAR